MIYVYWFGQNVVKEKKLMCEDLSCEELQVLQPKDVLCSRMSALSALPLSFFLCVVVRGRGRLAEDSLKSETW